MKNRLKYFLATMIACVFIFSSCKKDKEEDPTPTPAVFTPEVTAVGTETGIANSASIDISGGTIISSDGRLEVIIPANALSVATTISIQPITNEMSGGAGLAYRLLPNGQQFLQPVTIRFHYDSTDLVATDKRALDIAYQRADNIWYTFQDALLDSMSGTVSSNTTHFTDWALYKSLIVFPIQDVEVNVNGTVNLKVGRKKLGTLDDETGEVVWPLGGVYDYAEPANVTWSVNGVTGGTSNNGVISPSTNSATTVYTAPSTTANMQSNPVAATASVVVEDNATLHLPAIIKVTEGARYRITFLNDEGPIGAAGGNSGSCNWALSGYTDKGHFYITVKEDGTVELDSIVNIVPAYTFGSVGSCNCLSVAFPPAGTLDFTDFDGMIEFDGTLTFTMTTVVSSPTEVTICPDDPGPTTFDGFSVPIPETINVELPTDDIPYGEGWYTFGSMVVKKL